MGINLNDLGENSKFLIRGIITFSRVSRPTTDQERSDYNKKRKDKNPRAIDVLKNFTSISLRDCQCIALNPQALTPVEQYAIEQLYDSTKYPGQKCFTAMNKSRNVPEIYQLNAQGQYDKVPTPLKGELATGLNVTAVCRVFKGTAGNNGVTLDKVLVNEEIKYFEGGSGTAKLDTSLNEYGITFSGYTATAPVEQIAPVAGENEAAAIPTVNNVPVAQANLSAAAQQPNPMAAQVAQAPQAAAVNAAPANANLTSVAGITTPAPAPVQSAVAQPVQAQPAAGTTPFATYNNNQANAIGAGGRTY